MFQSNFIKQIKINKLLRIFFISSVVSLNVYLLVFYTFNNFSPYFLLCIAGILNGLLLAKILHKVTLNYFIPIIFLPISILYLFLPTHNSLSWILPISLVLLPISVVNNNYKLNILENKNSDNTINHIVNYVLYALITTTVIYLYYRTGSFSFQGDEYYIVKEMDYFFNEDGKLFYMGEDEPYGRSKLTSILLIVWIKIISLLQIDTFLTKEFVFRSLFTTLHILSALFIYKLSRFYVNKTTSLFIGAFFLTEIWFIYLGTYIRFYVPSLLLILVLLYYTQKFESKKSLAIATIISFLANFFVQAYFLFVAVFFATMLLLRLIKEKKYYIASSLTILGSIGLIGLYTYYVFTTKDSSYNSVSYTFNFNNIKLQSAWLFQNYFLYTIIFIGSVFWTIRNITKNIQPFLYVWLSLAFYFLYVNHVPFNFTFRPFYFFLPLLLLCSLVILDKVLKPIKLKYFIFSILLGINIIVILIYPANKPGKEYFPTKYIFEKHPIIFSHSEVYEYLDDFINYHKLEKYTVISLAFPDTLYKSKYFSISKNYSWNENDFSEYKSIIDKKDENTIVIVHSNSYCTTNNTIYKVYYNSACVTEVSDTYEFYIRNHSEYYLIFISADQRTKIYKSN